MFYFKCACGCGKKSKPLGQHYIRLIKHKWVKHKEESDKVVREFKGGFIIEREDF